MSEIKEMFNERAKIFIEHASTSSALKNIEYQIKVATEVDKNNISPSLNAEFKILSEMENDLSLKLKTIEEKIENSQNELKSESKNLKTFGIIISITSIASFWMSGLLAFAFFFGCLIIGYITYMKSFDKMRMAFGATQEEIDKSNKQHNIEMVEKSQEQEKLAKAIAKELKK
jgi:hypothetical protein